jgi:hypothetical protein
MKNIIKEDYLEKGIRQAKMQDKFTVGSFISFLIWAIWLLV